MSAAHWALAFLMTGCIACAGRPVRLAVAPGHARLGPDAVARSIAGQGWIPDEISATRVTTEWRDLEGGVIARLLAALDEQGKDVRLALELRTHGFGAQECRADTVETRRYPPPAAVAATCKPFPKFAGYYQAALVELAGAIAAQLNASVMKD
jgi:hypothetical protein